MPCWVSLQLKVGLFSFFRLKTVAHFVPIRSMLKMRVQPTRSFILIILRWWKWLQGKGVHLSNLCKFTRDHLISCHHRSPGNCVLNGSQNPELFYTLFLCSWYLSLCSVLLETPPYFMCWSLTAGICSLSLRTELHSVGDFFNLLYIYPFAWIVNILLSMLFSSTFFSMYLPAVFLYLFSIYSESFLNVYLYAGSSTGRNIMETSPKLQCYMLKYVKWNTVFKVFLSPVIQFYSISDLAWILSRRIQSMHRCLQKGENSLSWRSYKLHKSIPFYFLFFFFNISVISKYCVFCLLFVSSGINYDKPLPPIQVASLRAERIAKEKKVCSYLCCTNDCSN